MIIPKEDKKIRTTYPVRKIPYVPSAVRDMPFNPRPVTRSCGMPAVERPASIEVISRQQESPLIGPEFVEKIDLLQTRFANYSNFYIHFRAFNDSATAYLRLKDSPTEFSNVKRAPYLDAARVAYQTLETISLNSGEDPMIMRALDTFKKAYPSLFRDMQKLREK